MHDMIWQFPNNLFIAKSCGNTNGLQRLTQETVETDAAILQLDLSVTQIIY
jgi:hypothetical protein